MKICIELDEEMEEMWDDVKTELEHQLKYIHGIFITLPDDLVFLGLLGGFEYDIKYWLPGRLTKTELEACALMRR